MTFVLRVGPGRRQLYGLVAMTCDGYVTQPFGFPSGAGAVGITHRSSGPAVSGPVNGIGGPSPTAQLVYGPASLLLYARFTHRVGQAEVGAF